VGAELFSGEKPPRRDRRYRASAAATGPKITAQAECRASLPKCKSHGRAALRLSGFTRYGM
jgi:hypothetical protein